MGHNEKFLLLGMLILNLLICSCSKNCKSYMVPSDFKQYFFYPEGSWWVYKNQSGVYDTLTLKNVEVVMDKVQAESCDKYERISNTYKSTQSGEMTAISYHSSGDVFFFCFYQLDKSFFNDMVSFPILANNSHRIFACAGEVEWSIIDSVVSGNNTYHDVYQNQSFNIPQSTDTVPVTCYFVKNIGLIKKVMKNGEIWELVNYNVR